MLKSTLEDGWNFGIRNKLFRSADRLIQPATTVNFDATGEQLTGKQTDFTPLLDNGFISTVWLSRQSGLVDKEVEPL
jgi:hypothetical protein